MFFLSPSKSKARLRHGNNGDDGAGKLNPLAKSIGHDADNENHDADEDKDGNGDNSNNNKNNHGQGHGHGESAAAGDESGIEIPERRRSAVIPAELQREHTKKKKKKTTVGTESTSLPKQTHTSLHVSGLFEEEDIKSPKSAKTKLKHRASVINGFRRLFRSSKTEDKMKAKGLQSEPADMSSKTHKDPARDLDRTNDHLSDELGQFRPALEAPPHAQPCIREPASLPGPIQANEARQSSGGGGHVLPPAILQMPTNENDNNNNNNNNNNGNGNGNDNSNKQILEQPDLLLPPSPPVPPYSKRRSSNFSPFRSLLRLSQHVGSTTSLIADRRKEDKERDKEGRDSHVKINLTPSNLALLAKELEAIDEAEREKRGEQTPSDEAQKRKDEILQAMATADGDESIAQRALAARAARRERVHRHVGKWLEGVIDEEQTIEESNSPTSPILRPFSS
ncbi:hypothetical protein KEM54_002877 [Ascosphaera aggregata]|nr:hypothetical protein KEM54_002877 [Ascosphaera aggregata]